VGLRSIYRTAIVSRAKGATDQRQCTSEGFGRRVLVISMRTAHTSFRENGIIGKLPGSDLSVRKVTENPIFQGSLELDI